MRVHLTNILIPYILIIIIIENKFFNPNIILNTLFILSIILICTCYKIKKIRILVFFLIISSYNLVIEYNLQKVRVNVPLPQREVIIEVIFEKKKLIDKDVYYVGFVNEISINNQSFKNLIIYSKLINFVNKKIENKRVILKGILTHINQNGFHELLISRCEVLDIKNEKNTIHHVTKPVKEYIISILSKSFKIDKELFEFQKGVLLGNTENISKSIYDIFKFSGTLHLFAVSGLHIGFIYLIFKKVFSFLLKSSAIIEVLILIILVLYLYVVEYPPSAVRALLMIISWQFSQLISKKQNSVSSLMLSCYVVLLHDPRSIMDIGFQLSYSVVLSILIIRLNLRDKDKIRNFKIKDSLLISYGAFCGSFLLIFDYFQIIVPGSIFINIIIIPLIFIVIVCNFINLIFYIEILNYIIYYIYCIIIFISNNLSYNGFTYFELGSYIEINNFSHIIYPLSLSLFFSRFNHFLPRYLSYILIPIIILVFSLVFI